MFKNICAYLYMYMTVNNEKRVFEFERDWEVVHVSVCKKKRKGGNNITIVI